MKNKIEISKKEYDHLIECKRQLELFTILARQRLANGYDDMTISINKK